MAHITIYVLEYDAIFSFNNIYYNDSNNSHQFRDGVFQ